MNLPGAAPPRYLQLPPATPDRPGGEPAAVALRIYAVIISITESSFSAMNSIKPVLRSSPTVCGR